MKKEGQKLSAGDQQELLRILEARFQKHPMRHAGMNWPDVASKLLPQPAKLWSLWQMEESGGEPDVTGYDEKENRYVFTDCAAESPKAGGVFVTMRRHSTRAKSINLKTVPWKWLQPWGSVCSPSKSTANYNSLENSILKPQAGSLRLLPYAAAAARSSVTAGTALFSRITMAPSPITLHAVFAEGCSFSLVPVGKVGYDRVMVGKCFR